MAWRIGIDTGGTFTDVVAVDEQSGRIVSTKTPTTPANPADGFLNGIRKIAERAEFSLHEVAGVAHGTTIATNAVLQDQFPKLGLVVTRGFRAILEIGRQSVPQGYGNSYFWVKPDRIVPVRLVCEVDERLDFLGRPLRPLNVVEAEAAAAWLAAQEIECIGVCFLHAYANGEHERQMRDVLRRIHPHAAVSISSEVLPEYREYERAVTTLVDAFVKPRVASYVANVHDRLQQALDPATPFHIMKSNGGVISAREVARQPITTILSGPAAGALGAALLAEAAGFPRVLTLDGGGTSTDVALVEDGVPHLTTEGQVGRFPVKVPMIDVATVGSGGGSIAWLAADGRLRVGPRSAGADPGPLCYGRGGVEPTTTDASLLLGRIPPHLLGGEIPLDIDLARSGFAGLGRRLGLDLERAAAGVLEIAAWSQANAVRQVTTRRGLDVRDYLLVAFGGSGPLQAGRLVDILGLHGALIPPSPGNVSAFGLLTVDLKYDYVVTAVQRDDRLDLERTQGLLLDLEAQARTALEREAATQVRLLRSADLRYFGQSSEVRVDVGSGIFDRSAADAVVDRFHAAHERAYGYSYRTSRQPQVVEWVNLRVTGVGPIQRPRPQPLDLGARLSRSEAAIERRPAFFNARWENTPIYDRAQLQPRDSIRGPAIIQEFGSTTVVQPSLAARVDDFGNLILRRQA